MAGIPGWGEGGTPNAYPSRGRPQYGTNTSNRDAPNDWEGGARGPAALPSRTVPITPAGVRPAPPDMRGGAFGTISQHRGAFVENAAAPRMGVEDAYLHDTIPWSRPTYPNVQGLLHYHPPTQMPSWTANQAVVPALSPGSPIPISKRRITNFTVREQFGSDRQFFPGGSLVPFIRQTIYHVGMRRQGRRWVHQAKTTSPHVVNLARYGTAGSYGQTTRILATAPRNKPVAATPHGLY